jgi:hypothetical protein
MASSIPMRLTTTSWRATSSRSSTASASNQACSSWGVWRRHQPIVAPTGGPGATVRRRRAVQASKASGAVAPAAGLSQHSRSLDRSRLDRPLANGDTLTATSGSGVSSGSGAGPVRGRLRRIGGRSGASLAGERWVRTVEAEQTAYHGHIVGAEPRGTLCGTTLPVHDSTRSSRSSPSSSPSRIATARGQP